MSIPDTSEFREFCRSMTLVEPKNVQAYESLELLPESYASDATNVVSEPARRVWYIPNQINWEAFIRRLTLELKHRRHKCDVAVTRSFTFLYCLNPLRAVDPVSTLNRMLDLVTPCTLTQFFVLTSPPPPGFSRFTFGKFTIGSLNSDKLEARSRKAGSDFHLRYIKTLLDRLTIERDRSEARMIDLDLLRQQLQNAGTNVADDWNRGIEAYFQSLGVEFWDDFWTDFVQSQDIFIAAGAPILPDKIFQMLPFVERISIFMMENWGHVSPGHVASISFDFAAADKRIPEIADRLQKEYGFKDFRQDEIHQTLRTFASFVARAQRHEADGRTDDAFLHYIIALDMVFGNEQSIAKTTSSRVAVVVHRAIGKSYAEAVSWMSKAYAARSKYVHEGRRIERESSVEQLKAICCEVVTCLLRLQRPNMPSITLEQWLRQLDFVIASYEAGRNISARELADIGIT